MAHVIITETAKCVFTINAKVKRAPFACKRCGSRRFRASLTITAEAYPTGSGFPDGAAPVIWDDMDIYAAAVRCSECDLMIPGSGYTRSV
jgi:hypothetical protein